MPGSHRKVKEIQELRGRHWVAGSDGPWSREWVGPGDPGEDTAQFLSLGLTPSVTSVKAGDMVIFDTALFHSGCAAEDPTGAAGLGSNHLLRAIYIMVSSLFDPSQAHLLRAISTSW